MNFAEVKSLTIPEGAVVRILSGDTVLWAKATGGLPSAYQQVSHIETDGNQYIDTGVMASDHADGIRYLFRGNFTKFTSPNGNNYLFGCYVSGSRTGNPTVNKSTSSTYIIVGNQAAQIAVMSKQPAIGEDFELQCTATSENVPATTGSFNGTDMILTSSATAARNVAMPAANIWLFWINGLSTATKYCGKLYAFTMDTADGTPIRNFVPCYRKADGVIGLYDTVGGVFYTNAGTGSFAKGADV